MKIEQLGPYRIVRELGRGGMGTVFEGVNRETDEPAAVKLLAAPMARDENFRERFATEIETLKKLNHPNIVRLFGFGEQDGHLFYAMELVDGCSLEEELGRGRRFDWREVTRIGIDTCRALRHAHDRGVIHRDIKPGNLLLTAAGQVKLSDFGIARLFGNTRLTAAGSVLGTAEYMAPEQAEGQPASPRSDLYSLGAVLYVLLSGRPVFWAKSLPDLLHKQRYDKPDPIGQHAPDTPVMLQQIVMQLLDKDPERRIANPTLLARQLQAMERGLSLDPASDLPETKTTAAFKYPDEAEAAEETTPEGHFTQVPEEELDRIETAKTRPALISPQTWALAGSLIAVGLVVWYFLQPPSADALYGKITARTAAGAITSLAAAADDIEEFLMRFPEDSRCEQLRDYQREIDLHRLEQKFKLRAKGLAGTENLVPIERAYLEAINYVQFDPERAVAKLQALIDLYNHRAERSGPTGQCLELARRRLAQFREQLDRQTVQHLALIQDRLDRAKRLSETEPERAQAMYRAVIELYQHKPWAAQAVRRARDVLEEK